MDCLRDDELERVEEWPATDPRRVHAESCPRCRARRLALASFLTPEAASGSRPEEARATLLERVRRERRETTPSAPPGVGARPAALPRAIRRRWWERRGLLALAAGVAIVVAGVAGIRMRSMGPSGLERGPGAPATLRALGAEVSPAGVRFRWSRLEGAASYRVTLLGADLRPRFDSGATADTVLVLALPLPAGVRGADVALWQVAALRDDEVLAESAPREIRLP